MPWDSETTRLLIAVVLGGAISIIGNFALQWVQSRAQHKHERRQLAIEAAIEDRKHDGEVALQQQKLGRKRIIYIYPLVSYMFSNTRILDPCIRTISPRKR